MSGEGPEAPDAGPPQPAAEETGTAPVSRGFDERTRLAPQAAPVLPGPHAPHASRTGRAAAPPVTSEEVPQDRRRSAYVPGVQGIGQPAYGVRSGSMTGPVLRATPAPGARRAEGPQPGAAARARSRGRGRLLALAAVAAGLLLAAAGVVVIVVLLGQL